MERCPICKGRLKNNICSRCGTDLTMLLSIEQQAENNLQQAFINLNNGNVKHALLATERSLQLKREPLTLTLYNFLHSIALSKQKD